MELDYQLIGHRIRQKRKYLKITQESLAETIDVGTTHISHIETGNCIPSLNVFIKIILTLNISADEILGIHVFYNNDINNAISSMLSNCTDKELQLLINIIKSYRTL